MKSLDYTKESNSLRGLIAEKSQFLARLTSRVERLKKELLHIKQNYEVEIGKLYLELDQIDFAIFETRKLKDMMERGFSQAEAEKILRGKEADPKWKKESRGKKREDQGLDIGLRLSSEEEEKELKNLWRKLAYRFHPDRRGGSEDIMKQINKAYSERDLESLRLIDEEKYPEIAFDVQSYDLTYLSKKLKELEKIIDRLMQKYKAFRKSEWFLWKTKLAKIDKNKGNLFKEVARKLESTIIQRKRELARLKNSIVK